MQEFIDALRSNLDAWGELTEIILNAISLLCIIAGAALSLNKGIKQKRLYPGDHPLHSYFRLAFGGWLVVALEFQLAADIAATIVSPTTGHLVGLGAIALIRTFLNYFLGKELKEQKELLHKQGEKKKILAE